MKEIISFIPSKAVQLCASALFGATLLLTALLLSQQKLDLVLWSNVQRNNGGEYKMDVEGEVQRGVGGVDNKASTTTFQSIRIESVNNSIPNLKDIWNKLSSYPKIGQRFSTLPTCQSSNPIININQPKFIEGTHSTCPNYFQWILKDLEPWEKTKISQSLLESGRSSASFRVVIKQGRLYVDPYESCFQTRAVFTLWGILQLLNYYPNMVPDVDILIGCGDRPMLIKPDYQGRVPPPIFRYCTTANHFDIPFPDWTFWGWPEVKIRPWNEESSEIMKGTLDRLWPERIPSAFWKGNPRTSGFLRHELLKCNNSNAQIFGQDWKMEMRGSFLNSKISQQCKHRYKIYVEGRGWSVSLKYILACDSPVLVVAPLYYDFFSRGLLPQVHFWPVRPNRLCDSIKFGVDWGNIHPLKAQSIGKSGQKYITRDTSMKHVYDYMLHLLKEYSKLLDFVPMANNLTEISIDSLLCIAPKLHKVSFQESMIHIESDSPPCQIASEEENFIQNLNQRKRQLLREVQLKEDRAWSKS